MACNDSNYVYTMKGSIEKDFIDIFAQLTYFLEQKQD